jgi:hypothetical protein
MLYDKSTAASLLGWVSSGMGHHCSLLDNNVSKSYALTNLKAEH